MTDNNYLFAQWQATLGPGVVAPSVFDRILNAYSEPHRFYHTLAHLESCFRVLNRFFPTVSQSVRLTLWYHDIVYDTMSERNEDLSAEWALRDLRVLHLAEADVADLILATKHVGTSDLSPNAKIVVDVDLAILGETTEIYDQYEANVRKEYAEVPEETFWEHRKRILQRIANQEWIYQTPAMRHSDYEARAWQNLHRSLAR